MLDFFLFFAAFLFLQANKDNFSGYNPPTFWSECSLKYLYKGFSHGLGDACLFDQPNELFGGARCGNSIVEDGEQCDCGSTVRFGHLLVSFWL